MFTSRGLFSEIPCPHQSECLIPECIFSHKVATSVISCEKVDLVDYDRSRPQKRQKLESEDGETSVVSDKVKVVSSFQPDPLRSQGLNTSRDAPSALTREISPPPLRRTIKAALNPSAGPWTPLTGPRQPTPKTILNPSAGPWTPPTKSRQPHTALRNGISSASTTPVASKLAISKTVVEKPLIVETLKPRNLKGPPPAGHDMRLRLLRALYHELQRLNAELEKDARDVEEELVLSEQALITMTLDIEEQSAATTSIYSNLVKNKIMAYKRMNMKQWVEERNKEFNKAKAAKAALSSNTPGSKAKEPPKPIVTGLSTEQELVLVSRLCTPITGLSKHGYVTTIPTEEDISKAQEGLQAAQGWEQCDRCKGRFRVYPGRREEDGVLTDGGTCTYHYGRFYFTDRDPLDKTSKRTKRYRCCNEATVDSAGCTKSENHVFKITEAKRLASILNFAETPENPEKSSGRPVCIDGEMGYTVYGLELIRLTATSWPSGDALFDVLVRPMGEILDLNSRYSGVWPKDMSKALPWTINPSPEDISGDLRIVDSPAAARALLFSHISPQTPLIGHGLENDLNACRIIHRKVIDTALLYPHKAGLPYRNGLKALMQSHLNREIQVVVDGKMKGHDSKEDANAAGDLVRLALKNEWVKLQKEGWAVKDGVFVSPASSKGEGESVFDSPVRGSEKGTPASLKRNRDDISEDGELEG